MSCSALHCYRENKVVDGNSRKVGFNVIEYFEGSGRMQRASQPGICTYLVMICSAKKCSKQIRRPNRSRP